MSEQRGGQGDWRPRVEELIKRLAQDAEYRERIEADPTGELERLGLPGPVRDDVLHGIDAQRMCQITCTKGTSECTRSAYT